jgi:cytochrome c-type biogenesis protein CcmH
MTQFAIFATLLDCGGRRLHFAAAVAGPARPQTKADRKEANLAIFRDQLAELEREKPKARWLKRFRTSQTRTAAPPA